MARCAFGQWDDEYNIPQSTTFLTDNAFRRCVQHWTNRIYYFVGIRILDNRIYNDNVHSRWRVGCYVESVKLERPPEVPAPPAAVVVTTRTPFSTHFMHSTLFRQVGRKFHGKFANSVWCVCSYSSPLDLHILPHRFLAAAAIIVVVWILYYNLAC